jgi:hypothetical protein
VDQLNLKKFSTLFKLFLIGGFVLVYSAAFAVTGGNHPGTQVFPDLTASTVPYINSSKVMTSSSVTNTELGFLSGVTSGLQSQINGKQATGNYVTALTGEVTASGPGSVAATVTNSAVIGKVLTGYSSGAGTVSATDTILQAFQKLNGNDALAVLKSIFTAKGSIPVATASATVTEQTVGADGTVLTADSAQTNGIKWATPASAPSASYEISNCSLAVSVGSSALTVALKDAAGSNPSGGSPCKIGFRSATAATGTYSQVSTTSAVSVVISSGSTLGCTSAVECSIFVYALNNAGTVELAIMSSGALDEGTVQTSTTEGAAGAADSANVPYSTTGRSSVAFRLIGRLRATEATAGTWATSPSEVSNVPFASRWVTESLQASSSSVVTNEGPDDWNNGNCSGSGGSYTCTFTTNFWLQTPTCIPTVFDGAAGGFLAKVTAQSASAITIITHQDSVGTNAHPYNIICQGIRK